ncbi:MAG TPA: hypothetical protein VLY83_04535 [Methanoregula sp.]|nr:hypothetical protein [Methanoregula sp.]
MKPILDKSMFREATTDSGSLSAMSSIVHRIATQGEYRGTIYRGAAKAGRFSVSVCDCEEPETAGTSPSQADLDLVALATPCGAGIGYAPAFTLRTGGFLVFSVPTGSGEYAVELSRHERKKETALVFDSRKLGSGDIFITHVLRPGTYAIRNTLGKGHADLTVAYPEPGKPVCREQPVLVECKEGAMNPDTIKILPAQALMFSCARECRITIELKKADDRPRAARPPAAVHAVVRKKEKAAKPGAKKVIRRIRFAG